VGGQLTFGVADGALNARRVLPERRDLPTEHCLKAFVPLLQTPGRVHQAPRGQVQKLSPSFKILGRQQ